MANLFGFSTQPAGFSCATDSAHIVFVVLLLTALIHIIFGIVQYSRPARPQAHASHCKLSTFASFKF
jgi:hypothetical protein